MHSTQVKKGGRPSYLKLTAKQSPTHYVPQIRVVNGASHTVGTSTKMYAPLLMIFRQIIVTILYSCHKNAIPHGKDKSRSITTFLSDY